MALPQPAGAAPEPVAIDLVSPLPPVRSGIADYTADLLPDLVRRADVRLIHLPGQPVDDGLAARYPSAPATAVGGGRLPLYQMGNNRYHEPVLALALAHPGVLTLHDVVLHHLLLDVTLGRGAFTDYRDRLTADHGWIGEAVATAKRWGAYGTSPIFALPAHRTLLRRQRGILVHSAWAAGLVLEEDPDLRVRVLPMGVPLPPPPDPEAGHALRQRFGVPAASPLLGSFGFQTPIKRTSSVMRALADPALARAHLLVAGEASQGLGLAEEAERLGVAARVHVTGFLPFAELEQAIGAVDLCLNLRYPTAGETSASLLRVFALGRPAVVSEYAQFAELPVEFAPRVPLGDDEPAALTALLTALLAAPERLRAKGEAAREHVRRWHAPDDAAAALVAACREWAAAPPLAAEPPRVAVPSSVVWGKLPGEIEVAGAELPWPAGERRRLRVRLRNHGPAVWRAGDSGPGGMAVVVKLIAAGEDLLADREWLALPADLAPDEEVVFETEVRRPLGPPSPPRPPEVPRLPVPPGTIRLWIEPHLFGGLAVSERGGPRWERDL